MPSPLTLVLEQLKSVKQVGDNYTAICPAHKDTNPSLSIGTGEDGRVLLRCHTGCTVKAIVEAIGLDMKDLFEAASSTPSPTPQKEPYTVADLAEDKHIPEDFLLPLGLENRQGGVFIPYRSMDGGPAARHRLRTGSCAKDHSLWLSGKEKTVPYGLDRLSSARDAGYLLLVEGESDCWTCWLHDIPVLGFPGANTGSKLKPEYIRGINRLFVYEEPDQGGQNFRKGISRRLAKIGWKGQLFRIQLPDVKDLNDFHKNAPDQFVQAVATAMEQATQLPLEEEAPTDTSHFNGEISDILVKTGITSLHGESDPTEVEKVLQNLSRSLTGADPIRRCTIYQTAITQLRSAGIEGARKLVDAAFKSANPGKGDTQLEIVPSLPYPWDSPVQGHDLADTMVAVFRKYVYLPDHAPEATTLWVLLCYVFDVTDISPILAICSPEKRCGKTTLLELIHAMAPYPVSTSNITPAALFRLIDKYHPTLLIDEADTFLNHNDELRGILNCGHYRNQAFVTRLVGDDYDPKSFSTWCPKVIAKIDSLPSTLEDRSISINMKRKSREDSISRLRRRTIHEELESIRRQAVRWAADHAVEIQAEDVEDLPSLHDRAMDNWRPLLAIAKVLGKSWPVRAEATAIALTRQIDEEDRSSRIQLLADLHSIFHERDKDILSSEQIVTDLVAMEDRPWAEYRKGKELSKIQLSRLVKHFGVTPIQTHTEGRKVRGYACKDLIDAWTRYLPIQSGQPGQFNVFNDLDRAASRDAVGTVPTQLGTATQEMSNCPDSQSGCPESVPTQVGTGEDPSDPDTGDPTDINQAGPDDDEEDKLWI